MKVLMLAPGTRGDVAPAAGLAASFVAEGHEVTIVAGDEYAPLVLEAGCAHVGFDAPISLPRVEEMPPDGTPHQEASTSGRGSGVRAYLEVLRTYMDAAASAALAAAPGAEVILTNAISPYGHDIAEHLGVPSASALLQPAEPSTAYPPMIASWRDLGPANRWAGRLAERVRAPYDPACARVRVELGMPAETRVHAQRRRRSAGLRVHHGISSAVLPRPGDWPERLTLDGFWWPPPAGDATAAGATLSEVLASGPPPVVVTLGSLPPGGDVADAVAEAVRRTGLRTLLQGDALADIAQQLAGELGPHHVLHAGDVPHDWLLPRAAAVVHQAGAGVTAAALRAGVPSVTLPMHTDQPFWARRLAALSAGTDPIPMKRITADALVARITEAATSQTLRDGASRVREAIVHEDGTAPLRAWLRRLGS